MLKNREEILENAKQWFKDTIGKNHKANTLKLKDPDEFNINPFLVTYLAKFLTGNQSAESLAKALIYPRALGTSITTSFGQHIQAFTGSVLTAFGSTTAGIDIEFIDQTDGRKKYCQLKAGPNTINKDDVKTIADHFNGVIRLGRTNNLNIPHSDMIVGVIYGEKSQLSTHYKNITERHHFPVYAGQDFWLRLTGDKDFYSKLIEAIASTATEADFKKEFEATVNALAQSDVIQKMSKN